MNRKKKSRKKLTIKKKSKTKNKQNARLFLRQMESKLLNIIETCNNSKSPNEFLGKISASELELNNDEIKILLDSKPLRAMFVRAMIIILEKLCFFLIINNIDSENYQIKFIIQCTNQDDKWFFLNPNCDSSENVIIIMSKILRNFNNIKGGHFNDAIYNSMLVEKVNMVKSKSTNINNIHRRELFNNMVQNSLISELTKLEGSKSLILDGSLTNDPIKTKDDNVISIQLLNKKLLFSICKHGVYNMYVENKKTCYKLKQDCDINE
jgi:hypothetical protein